VRPSSPARYVALGFASAIVIGTLLLLLPAARRGPGGASLPEAFFTATSALCVTGLTVVDTPTHWSPLGHMIILILAQIGGFGIMALASLLGVLVSHQLDMSSRMAAAAETRNRGLGGVRSVLVGVAVTGLAVEGVLAVVLTLRFGKQYHLPWSQALWHGVFHSVSAFNNAGFALYSDSLVPFATDPWICLPLCTGVIIGGIGYPVLFGLRREGLKPKLWSLHTRLTVVGTLLLIVGGMVFYLAAEWTNQRTLGPLGLWSKLHLSFVCSVMHRTAGFNVLDLSGMHTGTWLGTDILMFIGGGSGGTAGGIKITTFSVLIMMVRAEIRGDNDVAAFRRRIPRTVQRESLAVAFLALGTVISTSILFSLTTDITLDESLFEIISATATVGSSTGITKDLPVPHQMVLALLMFIGRTGPTTLATALAMRKRERLYRFPEERPIVG
jgi:trk system potassium uptake protein